MVYISDEEININALTEMLELDIIEPCASITPNERIRNDFREIMGKDLENEVVRVTKYVFNRYGPKIEQREFVELAGKSLAITNPKISSYAKRMAENEGSLPILYVYGVGSVIAETGKRNGLISQTGLELESMSLIN